MSVQLKQNHLARGMEVWRPDEEEKLVWTAGAYQDMPAFEACSQRLTFRSGDGLPGMAWEHRAPIIMHNLYSGQFIRSEAASAVGLECGVALPFFRGRELRGVAVLLMESGVDVRGAIELWRPNDRRELGLSESYYANLDHFARLSQFVKFPCGAGLPGQIWQTRCPKVVDNLGLAPSFVRGSSARADRLTFGLGIPFMRSPWELESVAILLSSAESPLARRVEVWIRDGDDHLVVNSHTEDAATLGAERLKRGEGVAGRVLAEEAPMVLSAEDEPTLAGEDRAVGLPVFVGETLVAVVTLLS